MSELYEARTYDLGISADCLTALLRGDHGSAEAEAAALWLAVVLRLAEQFFRGGKG